MAVGCSEEGVSKLDIVIEALLVSWLLVKVRVGEEKESRVPPETETESPVCTANGRNTETVYVTPKSNGKEKVRV